MNTPALPWLLRIALRTVAALTPPAYRRDRSAAQHATTVVLWSAAPPSIASRARLAIGLVLDAARQVPGLWLDAARRTGAELAAGGGSGVAQDMRLGLRAVRRHPGLACAVIATLGVAIGTNAAMLAVVDAILLRPLPFRDPERLVLLWEASTERGWQEAQVAPANFHDWQRGARSFTGMAGFADFLSDVTLTGEGEPERLRAQQVDGDLFGVLGIAPAIGRGPRPEEAFAGAAPVVVLSHAFWQRRLGGARDVLGRTLILDGVPRTVVGVMPRDFRFFDDSIELWMPFGWSKERQASIWFRQAHVMRAVARLRPGVTAQAAGAEMAALGTALARAHADVSRGLTAGVSPLRAWTTAAAKPRLLVLLGAVGLLLLVACANVANLLVAHGAARAREMAIRGSLGASAARLLRQLATEVAVLAALGGLAGALLAAWLTPAFVALGPPDLPRLSEVHADARAAAVTFALTLLTAAVCAIVPARRAARVPPAAALGRAGHARGRGRLRGFLLAAQIAFALLTAAAAALLARSFDALRHVPAGFDGRGVLTARINLPAARYPDDAAIAAFLRRVDEAAGNLPELATVALTTRLSLSDRGRGWSSELFAEGWEAPRAGTEILHREVTASYLAALRLPLVAGRNFEPGDRAGAPLVLLVNRTFAERFFPGQSPLGRRVVFDRTPTPTSTWWTIVGVVGDERQESFARAPLPEAYAALAQDGGRSLFVLARGAAEAKRLEPALRRLVQAVDREVPVSRVEPMSGIEARSLGRELFLLRLIAAFAAIAVALAGFGVYAVASGAARERHHELAVRAALGGRRAALVRFLLRAGLRPAFLGMVAGVAAALAAGGLLRGLLFGVPPYDPLSLGGAALLLAALALGAGIVPALRASRTDPMGALRDT